MLSVLCTASNMKSFMNSFNKNDQKWFSTKDEGDSIVLLPVLISIKALKIREE